MEFFEHLDSDLEKSLRAQLRDLWTHTSTAIEGNTLTLGETKFVIEEGLTVSGKPLKDHQEVVGHARAIDLIYGMLDKKKLTETDLFDLHKAVLDQVVVDVYKPIGGWKLEPNGSYYFNESTRKQEFYEYSSPLQTPALMKEWIYKFNSHILKKHTRSESAKIYAESHISFVAIHPFFDGNGRIARLIANIPVLKSGHPPIVIPKESRKTYIDIIVKYQSKAGIIALGKPLVSQCEGLSQFARFCKRCWTNSLELVDKAHQVQAERDKDSGIAAIVGKIKNSELRDELSRHLRAVKNIERVGGLLKRRPADETSVGKKSEIGELREKLKEEIKRTKRFIRKPGISPQVKKAVLEFIKSREKQQISHTERRN
jgi:fido (protein-threonine AMPylation protein)